MISLRTPLGYAPRVPQAPGRATFSTAAGTVLATAGVAIGLGNIWRFPYMMGAWGGSAFLVLYLVIVVAFGIPALMAEYALGRLTRRGPVGAFAAARLPGARLWSGLLVLTIIVAGGYYAVVLGWVLRCAVAFARGAGTSGEQAFDATAGSLWVQLAFVAVTVGLSCAFLGLGVRRGIERLSVLALPLFFVLFGVLVVRVLTLEGGAAGLREFLVPRPGDFTSTTLFAAMGQAFFSLSLGGTFMVTYGSYLRSEQSIPGTAIGTALADVAAALLAGLIVVPAVFAFGLDLAGGPTLLFAALPEVFGHMPAGGLFGALFFLSVFLVGLLSLMAAFEVVVAAAGDALGWSRGRVLGALLILEVVLAVPALIVVGYIQYSDLVWGTTMQPLGSAIALVALAWCIGRARALEEIGRASRLPISGFLLAWIKYVLPAGILATLVYGWVSFFLGDRA